MAYKDKDRQRRAVKDSVRRHRAKRKGITLPAPSVIPDGASTGLDVIPEQSSTRAKIAARIAAVQPSNGTEQDDIRAASDRLVAALGGPAIIPNIPNYGQPDCQCMHCQQNRANGNKSIINHGPYKPYQALAKNEANRVSLPGDPDYAGVAQEHPEWPGVGCG